MSDGHRVRNNAILVSPRRDANVNACWADARHATTLLGGRAKRTLADISEDFWRWQSRHPHGHYPT